MPRQKLTQKFIDAVTTPSGHEKLITSTLTAKA